MGYCTATEVASEFKDIVFGTTGKITDIELGTFIDRYSSIIDSFCAARYVTPITGANALNVVKEICLLLVVLKVQKILAVKSGNEKIDQMIKEGTNPSKYIYDMLKYIQDLKIRLTDATLIPGHAGVTSFLENSSYTNVFQMDTTQW